MEEQEHIISQKENEVKLWIEKLQLYNEVFESLENQLSAEKQKVGKIMKKWKHQEERIKKLSSFQFKNSPEDVENYFDQSIDSDSQVSRCIE